MSITLCIKALIKGTIFFMYYGYVFTEISLNSWNSPEHSSKLVRFYSGEVLR